MNGALSAVAHTVCVRAAGEPVHSAHDASNERESNSTLRSVRTPSFLTRRNFALATFMVSMRRKAASAPHMLALRSAWPLLHMAELVILAEFSPPLAAVGRGPMGMDEEPLCSPWSSQR